MIPLYFFYETHNIITILLSLIPKHTMKSQFCCDLCLHTIWNRDFVVSFDVFLLFLLLYFDASHEASIVCG